MSAVKSRWEKLHDEITRERQATAHSIAEITNLLLRRLSALGTKGRCSPQAVGWIQTPRSGAKTKIEFKRNADGRSAWGHPAVRLRGLEHLEDGATLTVSIDVDGRKSTILSYSVAIEGVPRARRAAPPSAEAAQSSAEAGRRWYARVDLTETAAGQGLCGHPLLHCHVGGDPGASEKFSARVPLPWLHPADALDWLLATVDHALEPHVER